MAAAAPILHPSPSTTAEGTLNSDGVSWLERWSQRGWLALSPREQVTASTLGDWLVGCVEHALIEWGAVPRPPYVSHAPKDALQDQVYRAHMLGFQGLAVCLPSLAEWAPSGSLSPSDSAALLTWCETARALGVPLRLSEDDAELHVYEMPVPLSKSRHLVFPLVSEPPIPEPARPGVVEAEPTAEAAANDAPHFAAEVERPAQPSLSMVVPAPSRRQAMKSLLQDDEPEELDLSLLPPAHQSDLRALQAGAREEIDGPLPSPRTEESTAAGATEGALEGADTFESASPDQPLESLATPSVAECLTESREASENAPNVAIARPSLIIDRLAEPPPALSFDTDGYSEHIEALQASGGSHGWDDIEQLFESHYLPLQKAVRDGIAPALAAPILAEWAKDFAQSYEQAFDAIRNNRGRRPRLVLDVPSYAFQLSRKHNTEHLKLLLVDAMRADVGALVREKLKVQMANTAECVGSGLLWAALPANTAAQMELIARGTDGLRHFTGELAESQLMSRGNDLRRLRPVRVGSHRMYKLDIVQYLCRDAEKHSSDLLEQYAAEVATSVGRFLRQQEPNTLVYLCGDHGFGGIVDNAPEEILTCYQGWKVGG